MKNGSYYQFSVFTKELYAVTKVLVCQKKVAIFKFPSQLTVEYVTCIVSNITFHKPCHIQASVGMNRTQIKNSKTSLF